MITMIEYQIGGRKARVTRKVTAKRKNASRKLYYLVTMKENGESDRATFDDGDAAKLFASLWVKQQQTSATPASPAKRR